MLSTCPDCYQSRAISVQLLCGRAVIRTWTGLISTNQFTNLHSCFRRKKDRRAAGRASPAKTINSVPHSSQSKRKSDVSFPFSRSSWSIRSRKRLSRNEVTVRSLAPLSHDPRPEWNHSLNGLSSAMLAKTIMGPNLSLCVKSVPKTSLRRSSLFFAILFLFSSRFLYTHIHLHRGQRSGSHITGGAFMAWKLPSCRTTTQSLLCHHLFTEKASVQSFLE